jgi:hypothetical protein
LTLFEGSWNWRAAICRRIASSLRSSSSCLLEVEFMMTYSASLQWCISNAGKSGLLNWDLVSATRVTAVMKAIALQCVTTRDTRSLHVFGWPWCFSLLFHVFLASTPAYTGSLIVQYRLKHILSCFAVCHTYCIRTAGNDYLL